MRFFKYLFFFFLSIISIQSYAAIEWTVKDPSFNNWFSTAQAACTSYVSSKGYYNPVVNSDSTLCTYKVSQGQASNTNYSHLDYRNASSCTAGATRVTSGSYKLSNWANEDELVSLMNQSAAAFAGSSVCANSCVHQFDYTTNTSGDESNPPIVMSGSYKSTAQSCTTPTQGPTGELKGSGSGSGSDGGDGSDGGGGSDGGCVEGSTSVECTGGTGGDGGQGGEGGSGSGTGGKGGQGGQGGKGGAGGNVTLNMTPVVNAINTMSTNIVNKLTSVATDIKGSISQMAASVTDAIGLTNGKLDQVKSEISQQKAAIEANTNALNNQTSVLSQKIDAAATSVKNSISEMSAAVTDAIGVTNGKLDQVKSEIAQQKAAIEANTAAVNAQGKATQDAINAQGQLTQDAINVQGKATQNAINAQGKATQDAINANGKATQDAINAQGQATQDAINANGDKLKGSIDSNTAAINANGEMLGEKIDQTNSILDDIKEWLTGEPDTSSLEADIPTKELTPQSFDTGMFASSAQCPADVTLSLPGFARGFSKTFSFSQWCDYLAIIGIFILTAAYCMGAYIIVSKS